MKLNELSGEYSNTLPCSVTRAGIIPYYIDDVGQVVVYTMIPSDPEFGGTMPQMAKGQIDEGMSVYETALNEGHEELGLIVENIKECTYLGVYSKIAAYYCTLYDNSCWDEPHYETGWSGWINLGTEMHKIRHEHRRIFSDLVELVSED